MIPANDNALPFTITLSAPTRAGLQGMVVALQRDLEPGSMPADWIVRWDDENADGWPSATLQRRAAGGRQ